MTSVYGPACSRPSDPATSQLVEEVLVQVLVGILCTHRQEDVASDELMNHLKHSLESLEVVGWKLLGLKHIIWHLTSKNMGMPHSKQMVMMNKGTPYVIHQL